MTLPETQTSSPTVIPQSGSHLVRFNTTRTAISPYPIASQSLKLTLYSKEVRGYSRGPLVKLLGDVLACGPYGATEPWQRQAMLVHYANQAPFMHVDWMHREITVRPLCRFCQPDF